MSSVEEVRAQALEVAAGWSPEDAPGSWRLTAELFRVIASHDELLRRLAVLPVDRLPALLASAVLSLFVRRDQPKRLAGYFPEPAERQPPFDAGFSPAASDFITERLDDLMAECGRRRYQMNEVARCTQVALGIAATNRSGRSPVGLIDLGTGAGLGLQMDRYRYLVGSQASGPRSADLSLRCNVRGSGVPPPRLELPPIAERAGIDIAPVDLQDAAARSWLLACAPPESSALTRLAAAIKVTRQHPAEIVAGDVVDTLAEVLDQIDSGRSVIVTDAYLAVFLPRERRADLKKIMAEAGQVRSVTWLSLDPLVPLGPSGRDSVQDLELPSSLIRDYQQNGVFAVLGARTFERGEQRGRLLARAHPSGQWIEWLDRESGTPLAR
ncbi:MAG: DUF2332 domain-containing protein [Streptosporangiaceae bacterium]